jgi:hypothetical protein
MSVLAAMIHKPSPKPLSVRHDGDDLVISREWMRDIGAGLLLFGLLLLALALAVVGRAAAEPPPMAVLALLPGSAMLVGGVAAVVIGLYNLLNRTLIHLQSGGIHITHGPLPWRSQRIAAHQAQRVGITEYYREGMVDGHMRRSVYYTVRVADAAGVWHTVVRQIAYSDDAQMIAQSIAERYSIPQDATVVTHLNLNNRKDR